jgi:Cys-tRNA(Pro)/Cys-tRNA(Cys) deacylase
LARRDLAEGATGNTLGAISPIGQDQPLSTFVDAGALAQSTVFVSGGRPGLEIELSPNDLLRATRGRSIAIALVSQQ